MPSSYRPTENISEAKNAVFSGAMRAAEGWLELGDVGTAFKELEQIASFYRLRPEVLQLQWRLHAAAAQWNCAFTLAGHLCHLLPGEAQCWVWRAHAARRMQSGGTGAAFDLLSEVAGQFPRDPFIPYALACYSCQMGRIDRALEWLAHALDIAEAQGTRRHWRLIALGEGDLEPIWPELRRPRLRIRPRAVAMSAARCAW